MVVLDFKLVLDDSLLQEIVLWSYTPSRVLSVRCRQDFLDSLEGGCTLLGIPTFKYLIFIPNFKEPTNYSRKQ